MTLHELKARAAAVLVAAAIFLVIVFITSVGEATGLLATAGFIGGLAFLVWIAAVVADATVHSLKKEN